MNRPPAPPVEGSKQAHRFLQATRTHCHDEAGGQRDGWPVRRRRLEGACCQKDGPSWREGGGCNWRVRVGTAIGDHLSPVPDTAIRALLRVQLHNDLLCFINLTCERYQCPPAFLWMSLYAPVLGPSPTLIHRKLATAVPRHAPHSLGLQAAAKAKREEKQMQMR